MNPVADYERGMTQIGPRTYAFMQPDGGWGWSNAGLIVGEKECILVDTFFDLERTTELLDAVRNVTDAPIRTVVNTHHNGDHTWGNQLVEGATIVGHLNCRSQLLAAAPPDFLSGIMLSRGDEGAVGYLKRAFAPFRFEGIEVTPPTITFEQTLTLFCDDRQVQLLYFGPGHTLGDVVVWVPDDGVLFAGDLLFLGSTPLVWEGSLQNWIAAVDGMLALEPTTIVPGHGPLCGPEGLREMQGYLQHVVSAGARLREKGMSPLEAATELDIAAYGSWADPERLVLNLMRLDLELDGNPAHTPIDPLEAFSNMALLAERRTFS